MSGPAGWGVRNVAWEACFGAAIETGSRGDVPPVGEGGGTYNFVVVCSSCSRYWGCSRYTIPHYYIYCSRVGSRPESLWRTSTIKKTISESRNSYGYPRSCLCSLATQVVKAARPKTKGCLCCVGWVGGRAQGLISQGRSRFLHVRRKQVSANLLGRPLFR